MTVIGKFIAAVRWGILRYKMFDVIDYEWRAGDKCFYTYKLYPEDYDWHSAVVLDVSYFLFTAVIKVEGYSGVTITSLKGIHRTPKV